MRNMALLIDTNVILNYITNRDDPYLEQSVQVVRCCADGRCTGYTAFHTLSTLWYVLRKRPDKERREILRDICTIFDVATASRTEILDAIDRNILKTSKIVFKINVQRKWERNSLLRAI